MKLRDKMSAEAEKMGKLLVGRKVVSVSLPVEYPGQYRCLTIVFDDGTRLEVSQGSGAGCNECDPEGMGFGVNVSVVTKTRKKG